MPNICRKLAVNVRVRPRGQRHRQFEMRKQHDGRDRKGYLGTRACSEPDCNKEHPENIKGCAKVFTTGCIFVSVYDLCGARV
jgi:hypothetical protein